MSSNMRFTEREMEIIRLLILGEKTDEIALQLNVSPRAVERHLTHIYRKLEVFSRVEAVVKLLQLLEK